MAVQIRISESARSLTRLLRRLLPFLARRPKINRDPGGCSSETRTLHRCQSPIPSLSGLLGIVGGSSLPETLPASQTTRDSKGAYCVDATSPQMLNPQTRPGPHSTNNTRRSPLAREDTLVSARPPTKLTIIYQERIVHARPPPPHSAHTFRETTDVGTATHEGKQRSSIRTTTTCRVHTIPQYTVPFAPAKCKAH